MSAARRPPWEPGASAGDAATIAAAAGRLDIGEYELFALAYEAWHGRPGAGRALDGDFGRYMMHRDIPFWARHFSRAVLASPDAAAIARLLSPLRSHGGPPPAPPPHGRLYATVAAAVAVLFVALLIVAPSSADRPAPASSPICAGGPGMDAFARYAARAFAGRSDCR